MTTSQTNGIAPIDSVDDSSVLEPASTLQERVGGLDDDDEEHMEYSAGHAPAGMFEGHDNILNNSICTGKSLT